MTTALRPALALALLSAAPGGCLAATPREAVGVADLPMHFEANRGQADPAVRFTAQGAGYSVHLTSREAVLLLDRDSGAPDPVEAVALRLRLVGARMSPAVAGVEELPGKANYFIGDDPAKWQAGVPTYEKVRYSGVYPGIDLIYYGNQQQLEYDFIVAPGADTGRIGLDFGGVQKLEIASNGDLLLHTAAGAVRQHRPIAYQEFDGVRRQVGSRYVRRGPTRVGVQLDEYDRSLPLIIDPVIAYASFLGGAGRDMATAIAVDGDGNIYVSGVTTSSNFPVTAGAVQSAPKALYQAFVSKISGDGTTLLYSTYLGAAGTTTSADIAIDAAGNAYVIGTVAAADFPTTTGVLQPASGGDNDAFVSKLDPSGALVYSTYLGGQGNESGSGIAVDSAGSAYLAGATWSADFRTTPGAFQTSLRGTNDVFVAKLDAAGTALLYSTLLGGSSSSNPAFSYEFAGQLAIDLLGQAHVVGITGATDFPVTPGAFQDTLHGEHDGFVAKLDATGQALIHATYLGGAAQPSGYQVETLSAIALDAQGNAHVIGATSAPDHPVTAGALQGALGGVADATVAKFGPTGQLMYSTYLGGSDGDTANSIAVAADGSVLVTGRTGSPDFPVSTDALQPQRNGGFDAFIARLNPAGSGLVYSSHLGGPQEENGYAIAVDPRGGAFYVAGTSYFAEPVEMNVPCPAPCISGFATTPGAFQVAYGGSFSDGFIVKFTDATVPQPDASPPVTPPATPPGTPPVTPPDPPRPPRGGGGALDALTLAALAALLAGTRMRGRRQARR